MFVFTFITPVDNFLLDFISYSMTLISWTMIFFGVWIIFASIYQMFYTKVLGFSPALLTILRCLIVLLLATFSDLIEKVVSTGVSL